MLTLFHHPMSASSRAIRLSMAEYNLHINLIEEQLWQRREEFLALNPAATLPVLLIDDNLPIIGATVIAEYLDETQGILHRDRRLFPEYPVARAEMRRIVDWALTKLEAEVIRYTITERFTKRQMVTDKGGASPNSTVLRVARKNIRYHLNYLEWLAGTRNWIAGSTFTYADLAVSAALSTLDYLGEIDWERYLILKDWYTRLKSRPSFRTLLSDRLRTLPPVSHYVDLDF
ncbi:glutathione S-transferase family protein [Candidatus Endowatersipora endosymbiont of Watersipora subatra]|uniref:glutathione S-transferase family protein n=1 Tax=Candidatus Endowatersipora endosymbiont of Watersipora subatra TaxID=3077946 RepID=UPI00312C8437